MDYLIQKYGNTLPKKAMCECCGKEFETNINRLRCSKSCANIMKHRRKKDNHSFSVKYEKETTVKTTVDVFGFINRAIY